MLSTNIKGFLIKNDRSQLDLAEYVGVKANTVSDWINKGNSPKEQHIYRIAEFFGISVGELFGDKLSHTVLLNKDEMLQEDIMALYETANEQARQTAIAALKCGQTKLVHKAKPKEKGTSSFIQITETSKRKGILVPIVGKTAAGMPIEMIENDYGEFSTDDHSIRAGDFGVIASGDSMIGANIHDGDVVIIRPQPMVNSGDIALVSVGDNSTIKKIYLYPNRIELAPMNDNHETQVYNQDDDVRILGKVITTIAAM